MNVLQDILLIEIGFAFVDVRMQKIEVVLVGEKRAEIDFVLRLLAERGIEQSLEVRRACREYGTMAPVELMLNTDCHIAGFHLIGDGFHVVEELLLARTNSILDGRVDGVGDG